MGRPSDALRPRAIGGLFGTLLTAGVLSAAGAGSVGAQLRGPELLSVRFEGNESFPDDSLARAIVSQETECRSAVLRFPIPFCGLGLDFALRRSFLRTRQLPLDQTRLIIWYQRRGFFEVEVAAPRLTESERGVDVLFSIDEGSPVVARSIAYEGTDGLDVPDLLDDLPIEAGVLLSTASLEATSDSIRRRLNDRGYAYADVFRRALRPTEDPYNAEVTFEVVPGPRSTYGQIDVTGLEKLSLGTVLRTLPFTTRDVYRASDVQEAGARLRGLEIVRNASVTPIIEQNLDSVIDIRVELQESDAYRVRAGGGWSSSECLNIESRWTSRNFAGGGRLLQVRGRLGNVLAPQFRDVLCTQSGLGAFADPTWRASVDLVQPWIFSTRNALTAAVFGERQSLPDVFIRRAIGFEGGLVRTVRRGTLLTLFFRPELSELDADDVLFCTGFLVCAPSDIAELEGANWLSPVGVNMSQDYSDDLLNPRRGRRLVLELEHAGGWTGSDFRYDRVVLESSWYAPLASGAVLATRFRGGWVGSGGFADLVGASSAVDVVHPQKRFFAGGANSVRGFSQSRLGPRVLVTSLDRLLSQGEGGAGCAPASVADRSCDASAMPDGSFQVRPTGGARVLEANAELRFRLASWLEGVTFTDVGQAWASGVGLSLGDLEFSPGMGIRFPSPVGPIRLDVAYRFRGGEFLDVVTPQITPFDAQVHDLTDRIVVDGGTLPWVRTEELALLGPAVLFGEREGRIQVHISIGQAF